MTDTQTITNLSQLASQLANTAKGLHAKVKETKQALTLTGLQLKAKIPQLEGLGETVVFRLREMKNGLIACDTLGVWLGENGKVAVFSPDLTPVAKVKILSYNSGINGFTIVEIDGIKYQIGFNPSQSHIEELVNLKVTGIDGEGSPKPEMVAPIPQPEIPIYSDEIPNNVTLTVVKTGKQSRKFSSPLIDIETPTGEILKNVICNADLSRIVETYGKGATFKIVGKAPKLNKDGLPIDAEGKVNKLKPAYMVQIADLQQTDFSDLTV
jgi:hypothetical protein